MTKQVKVTLKSVIRWSKEDEELLDKKIIKNFYELLNSSEEDGLYWTGMTCDLIDLAHIVWESGLLLDDNGHPMEFREIVHTICKVLHVHEPRNPSSVISAVRARKNIRVSSIRDRYLHLIHDGKILDPMRLDIRFGERAKHLFMLIQKKKK
ncbi:hypothetical protein [Prevotella sp.]